MTRFGKFLKRGLRDLAEEAVQAPPYKIAGPRPDGSRRRAYVGKLSKPG